MFAAWFWDSEFSGSTLIFFPGKIVKTEGVTFIKLGSAGFPSYSKIKLLCFQDGPKSKK